MAMNVEPMIRSVFGPFQNLNLLVLLEDLRHGRTAQGDWSYGDQLCPVAHGLASGRLVCDLETLDQAVSLGRACDLAARYLGADPSSVYRFVRYWDTQAFSPVWLLHQLEELWNERRADAEAVQKMLMRPPLAGAPSEETAGKASPFGRRLSLETRTDGHECRTDDP